ncbi:biofilm regulation diguanylate cyclase SiaD [Methylomagnum sp.]
MLPHSHGDDPLEKTIEALLADEQYLGHPLREALFQLWNNTRDQLAKLERITKISDRYQNIAQEKARSMSERYNRQLRQIEKITRISDRYQLMLQDLNIALKEASTHDPLTGLGNRRLIIERLKQEDERAMRLGLPYVVALIDADRFKQINDEHGHDGGDQVLVGLAQILKSGLRGVDLCGRWGGEEFLALLVDTNAESAQAAVERMLVDVRKLTIPMGDKLLPVTVSIGFTEHRAGESYFDTIKRADAALLEAKRSGKDKWVAH